MTDVADLTIEQRLAILEARAGIAAPLALVPPITIGELQDVPAPGSQIAAQWAQEVSSRVVQRFPTTVALKAWAAPNGAYAVALDTNIQYRRVAGTWQQVWVAPWTKTQTGSALDRASYSVESDFNYFQIPADPAARIAIISCHVRCDISDPAGDAAHMQRYMRLEYSAAMGTGAQPVLAEQFMGTAGSHHFSPTVLLPIAAGASPFIRIRFLVISPTRLDLFNIYAQQSINRLDAYVVGAL